MRKFFVYIGIFCVIGSLAACRAKKENKPLVVADSTAIDLEPKIEGDSMIYALACDGCTDSVLVILPYSGGNPDTLDIIDAKRAHRVFGRPKIGARLAVMVNPEDSDEATFVVNMDELKGAWCYKAKPKFRDMEKMPPRVRKRMMESIPDSVRDSMLVEKEMGFQIKRSYAMQPIGVEHVATTDEQSPLEYPEQKMYSEWRLFNGKLLLSRNIMQPVEGTDSVAPAIDTDTVQILMLMPDSLVLLFPEGPKGYYRQK